MNDRAIRTVSFNVQHCLDLRRGTVDVAAAADALAGLDADVVALQEVDRDLARSGHADQVAELAARLGRHGVFAPALLGDPDRSWAVAPSPPERDPGGPAFGVGLLTREPLRAVAMLRLPGGGPGTRRRAGTPTRPGWDREPRIAVAGQTSVRGAALTVATAHLSYLPWRAVAQLRAAGAFVAARGGPVLLAGDFNLPPQVVRAAAGRGWRQAAGPPTYPSWRPWLRPDQLLVTGGLTVVAVGAADAPVSDHRPLVATVRVR